jgi:hypothetical protein
MLRLSINLHFTNQAKFRHLIYFQTRVLNESAGNSGSTVSPLISILICAGEAVSF